ncbi:MAG: hypothetical protein B6U76_00030 [Desulfurococcales archaeon ex4484_217_2]|nr:MAG: hypothetical protein B6U76_00030 [Desulfurococcales archaeon ex4484_217_2]
MNINSCSRIVYKSKKYVIGANLSHFRWSPYPYPSEEKKMDLRPLRGPAIAGLGYCLLGNTLRGPAMTYPEIDRITNDINRRMYAT